MIDIDKKISNRKATLGLLKNSNRFSIKERQLHLTEIHNLKFYVIRIPFFFLHDLFDTKERKNLEKSLSLVFSLSKIN